MSHQSKDGLLHNRSSLVVLKLLFAVLCVGELSVIASGLGLLNSRFCVTDLAVDFSNNAVNQGSVSDSKRGACRDNFQEIVVLRLTCLAVAI